MSRLVSIERDGAAAAREALASCLGAGETALFPADGVYGLGCDPLDGAAIACIHRLKGREEGKPAAILYLSPLAMRELVEGCGPLTQAAMAALLPGPVTLVIANRERRYPLACRADPERLGVRLIGGPLQGTPCPLFQTSANLSGEPPPGSLPEVAASILAAVDLAIDGGALSGAASTVVDLSGLDAGGDWRVLREGALPLEQLAARLAAIGSGA